ncbi:MAG: T9SS type A sorting domain-containing protein [Prolixibacteraceae bacterium]|jgi:hypothetical protein|nr:T9SS type A sorting domain-containing protein [Prolixibacteraceae bacterium]
MKLKIIILALISFSYLQLMSQEFIDSTKTWTVAEYITSGPGSTSKTTITFSISGDTLIENTLYAKMFSLDNDGNIELHSLWREEESGEVYFRRGLEGEQCIYNFQLEEGDTFNIGSNEIIVDSVMLKNFGSTEKKFLYAHYSYVPDHVIVWIEGVGSLNAPGVPDEYFLDGGSYTLICYHENDELIFLNPNYTDCNASSGTSAKDVAYNDNLIRLFPVSDLSIKIDIQSNESGNVDFYTIEGKHALSETLQNSASYVQLPKQGIYIYRFTSNEGEIQTGKVYVK